ncbi:MAG: DUF1028 domain-containing protein [Hyphomonadaceae bacterium]|nr:DUF1028 domain-containing protein [Hyphomonadaceae bacterium]
MTFSIIARDEDTGRIGVAVASKFFAVGARSVFVRTGVGAVVSQAFFNPYYGPRGLALLAAGAAAADTIRLLIAADQGSHMRQVHVMDRSGQFAAHTGDACADWCGHLGRRAFSVAGNTLAGADVLDAMAAAYEENDGTAFARRLIAALEAGEAAGGDTRGRQSAALIVHDREEYSLLDLRVDDHPGPLAEIARLEEVARQSWVHFRRVLPSARNPSGILDGAECHAWITASIAEGYE